MAFGGYKFAGYKVYNSNFNDTQSRCLAIHIARIRAFMDASRLSGSSWKLDGNWLCGDINYDNVTNITNEYNCEDGNIHVVYDDYNVCTGYSTYFKYNKDDVHGYYYILTLYEYSIVDGYGNGVTLPTEYCLTSCDQGNTCTGPIKASCFHCLSLEPFGEPEHDNYYDNKGLLHKYLLNNNQKSTKLTSIGSNTVSTDQVLGTMDGFVNNYSIVSMFGYCIKDSDIISICGSSEYGDDPFSNGTNTHVTVMSLNGLSELYNADDAYKLLQLDINNSCNSTESWDANEIKSDSDGVHLGNSSQILNENGEPILYNSNENDFKLFIPFDIRSMYCYSDDPNVIPYNGIPIGVMDVSNNNTFPFANSHQFFKGCTNPELVAMNYCYSDGQTYIDRYTTEADGSLLYLYSYEPASFGMYMPIIKQGDTNIQYNDDQKFCGKFNFYIGWDGTNPDIHNTESWVSYDSDESDYKPQSNTENNNTVYRTELFTLNNNQYYFEIDRGRSTYGGSYNVLDGGVQIKASIDGQYFNFNISSKLNNFNNNVWSYISDNTVYGTDNLSFLLHDNSYLYINIYNKNAEQQSSIEINNDTVIGPLRFEAVTPTSDNNEEYITTEIFVLDGNAYYFKISNVSLNDIHLLSGQWLTMYMQNDGLYIDLNSNNEVYGTHTCNANMVDESFEMEILDTANGYNSIGSVKLDLYNDTGNIVSLPIFVSDISGGSYITIN